MRKQLRQVDRMDELFALELHSYSIFYNKVGSKSALQLHSFVNQRDSFLLLDSEADVSQFIGQASFIC